ncbi:trypsin inhibitor-like cysteine-rich domain-containing protein [Tenacibaculum sp. A30]|uniref:trypsin inhibitor-like cysteine-rich domain-containing protein n=1 Tax=Tenacibaculum sp. A30 TaxID=3442644 RepID=UPI003EBBDEEA
MKNRKISFIKLGILLFGISNLIWNCEKEEYYNHPTLESINVNAETVSFKEAKQFYKNQQKINVLAKTSSNQIKLTPNWNTIKHNKISYTNALLTTVKTHVSTKNIDNSKLYFLKVNGIIKNVIVTTWTSKKDNNDNIINAKVFFNDITGKFIDGYVIEEGKFTKRILYKAKPKINQASFFFFFQECGDGSMDVGLVDPDQQVNENGEPCFTTPEIIINGSSGGGGNQSSSTGTPYPYIGYLSYYDYINNAGIQGSGLGGGGSVSITPAGITSATAAILMNPPIPADEDGNCPEGYIKNPTTGECNPICHGDKIYNSVTQKCECPNGQIEDSNGNCITENPCNEIKEHLSTSKSNIKPKLNTLKTKVDYPGEKGYAFIKNSNGTFLNREVAVSALNFNSVKIPTGNGIYAGAHTHTDDLYNMFSWSDVHTLYSLYNDASNDMKSNAMLYLVARKNTTSPAEVYGIIVEDFNKLKNQLNKDIVNTVKNDLTLKNKSLEDIIKDINRKLGDQYDKSNDRNKTFLNRFKNHGIKLFKGNSNLSNFSELTIDATTNTVKQTPC